MLSHSLTYSTQNVIFTLFIGFLGLCALEYFKERPLIRLLSIIVLLIITEYLRADYRMVGFLFILLMYGLRNQKVIQSVVSSTILPMPAMVFLSFMVIYMYNGERGFLKSKFWKYFFYAFYPLHMLIIYFLAR